MKMLYNHTENYPAKLPNCQIHRKEETCSTQVKRTISQYRKYSATVLNAHFEQVSIKSKIVKQFMYNRQHLAKILSKFYGKDLKAGKRDTTIIFFLLPLGRFLAYELLDQKI